MKTAHHETVMGKWERERQGNPVLLLDIPLSLVIQYLVEPGQCVCAFFLQTSSSSWLLMQNKKEFGLTRIMTLLSENAKTRWEQRTE